MEFLYPESLTNDESNALVDRFDEEQRLCGFCPWVVELAETATFIGFVGLHRLPEYLVFAPGIEIGWRLVPWAWGSGFATEAAKVAVDYAFNSLDVAEVVSMTSALNVRSRRVMEKLTMAQDPSEDFEHPRVPEGHRLRHHVLYRLVRRDPMSSFAGPRSKH
jgi:RimJ/RimL family protein N-acetyltransferase